MIPISEHRCPRFADLDRAIVLGLGEVRPNAKIAKIECAYCGRYRLRLVRKLNLKEPQFCSEDHRMAHYHPEKYRAAQTLDKQQKHEAHIARIRESLLRYWADKKRGQA